MTFERLSDVAIVTPGTSPKGELINSDGRGYPFFQGSKEFKELYPVVERYTELPVKLAKAGDILIGVRAPVGEVNFALHDCAIGRGVMSVRAKLQEEQKYIFYFLKNLQGKWDSLGSTGSVFENLSTIALNSVELPTVNNREMIGEILFNLDKKIAINNALSKTLEDIAQTIFKSWFIDFDPVKAKMNGKKPIGMDDETAALFPDSFEESELGLLPKGWQFTKLERHLKVTKGKSYKSSELEESNTALVTLKSFLRGGGYRFDGLKPFSGEYKPEQVIKPGELIVSFTDVTQAADVIGKPAIVLGNPRFKTLVASLDVGIVRPQNNSIGKSFLYQLFSTSTFKNHVEGYTNGTTVLHLGKGALEDFELALPPQNLMTKFEELASILSEKIQVLYLENLYLIELRDALLPRLISGELKIPEEMLAS
jgi:type I restriction enzyme S subunit